MEKKNTLTSILRNGAVALGIGALSLVPSQSNAQTFTQTGKGYCADINVYECATGWQSGKCPGASNIKYCSEIPTIKESEIKPTTNSTDNQTGLNEIQVANINKSGLELTKYAIPTSRSLNAKGEEIDFGIARYFGQKYIIVSDSVNEF